ncbi:MAG TPA: hypothetical protein PL110_10460 [Candidatus Eremiobacteraeota bacterium]|nr:MAG: hypothetical protein BWY64_00646 [bacterium ADurb.Bin363]HPZ08526.1 hypothetical protein [Candidatus Eremiobacteraeota bacterium]
MDRLKPLEIGMQKIDINRGFLELSKDEISQEKRVKKDKKEDLPEDNEKKNQFDFSGNEIDDFCKEKKSSFVFYSKGRLPVSPEKLIPEDIYTPFSKKPLLSKYFEYEIKIQDDFKITPIFITRLLTYLCEDIHINYASTISSVVNYFFYLVSYSCFSSNYTYSVPIKPLKLSEKYFEKVLNPSPDFFSIVTYSTNLKPLVRLMGKSYKSGI